jgi:hypothetical protein
VPKVYFSIFTGRNGCKAGVDYVDRCPGDTPKDWQPHPGPNRYGLTT